MEKLVFKYRIQTFVRIVTIVLFSLVIVYFFVQSKGSVDLSDFLLLIIVGLYYVLLFIIRSDKSRMGLGENCLKIKWVNWFREIVVTDAEIEKIILARQNVSISRKGKRAVKLTLESLEKDDKTKIYEFLIDYSKQKNLVLERQPNL